MSIVAENLDFDCLASSNVLAFEFSFSDDSLAHLAEWLFTQKPTQTHSLGALLKELLAFGETATNLKASCQSKADKKAYKELVAQFDKQFVNKTCRAWQQWYQLTANYQQQVSSISLSGFAEPMQILSSLSKVAFERLGECLEEIHQQTKQLGEMTSSKLKAIARSFAPKHQRRLILGTLATSEDWQFTLKKLKLNEETFNSLRQKAEELCVVDSQTEVTDITTDAIVEAALKSGLDWGKLLSKGDYQKQLMRIQVEEFEAQKRQLQQENEELRQTIAQLEQAPPIEVPSIDTSQPNRQAVLTAECQSIAEEKLVVFCKETAQSFGREVEDEGEENQEAIAASSRDTSEKLTTDSSREQTRNAHLGGRNASLGSNSEKSFYNGKSQQFLTQLNAGTSKTKTKFADLLPKSKSISIKKAFGFSSKNR